MTSSFLAIIIRRSPRRQHRHSQVILKLACTVS